MEEKLADGARTEASAHHPTKLYAALVRAQAAVRAVAKDSTNAYDKYKYASADDLMAEGGRALASAELALFPMGWSHSVEDGTAITKDGEIVNVHNARIAVRFRLIHSSGECLDFDEVSMPAIVQKGRPADKAESTARTYILGYFVRDLLMIPRVEAGSQVDQRDDREYEPAAAGPGVAKAAPAPQHEQEPGWAMKSVEITGNIEKALRASKDDANLVEASKAAPKALNDKQITKVQYDALAKIFVECRKALATPKTAEQAAS